MVTDSPPRRADKRRQFEISDQNSRLPLPPAEPLQQLAAALRDTLASGAVPSVCAAGQALLDRLSTFYGVEPPSLLVLGVRPHRSHEGRLSYELFGDYTFDTKQIRCWMRTAVQGKVTSYRGFLNTLLHEFCHHLDVLAHGLPDTPHTRGFFGRVDELYHLALATPPDQRRPLVWIQRGSVWQIDWRKLRTPARPQS